MKKKKKVDYEALSSPFMRIPRITTEVVRAFLDLDMTEVYELSGRSPDSLYADWSKKKGLKDPSIIPYFKMSIYFAETEEPDMNLMFPSKWE